MSGAVLRQLRLEGAAALPLRTRGAPAAPSPENPLAAAVQAGYEEGFRKGQEEGVRQGYEVGHAKGLAAAEKAGAEAGQALRQQAAQAQEQRDEALRGALQASQRAVAAFVAAAEEDMVALCFEALCKCFGELATQPDSVRSQVRAALGQWRGSPPLAIHLHPADLQLLQAGELAPACVPDPAIPAGGCIVRGTQGALDARLDGILAQARQLLLTASGQRARAEP